MNAATDIFKIIWPVLLLAMILGVLVNVAQTGIKLTGKTLMPKFSRINPIEGIKRIVSTRSLMELFKALLKVACLATLVYHEYSAAVSEFPSMMNVDVKTAFGGIMKTALDAWRETGRSACGCRSGRLFFSKATV